MIRAALISTLFALLLTGCTALAPPAVSHSGQSGVSGAASAQVWVAQSRHFPIAAEALITDQGPRRAYALAFSQIATSTSRIRVTAIRQAGEDLPFDRTYRALTCGGLTCLRNLGLMVLSADMAAEIDRNGLEARMITSQGPIDIAVPPGLFSQAAAARP